MLTPGPIAPEALAALLRTIAGAAHAPPRDRTALLARDPRPATLWGARIMAAGHLGPGWLVTREARAMAGPVEARPGMVWDGRFRIVTAPEQGATVGPLGADAALFRDRRGLPAAVLHGLPAVRRDGRVIAVPHMSFGDTRWVVLFDPRNPAACAPFVPG